LNTVILSEPLVGGGMWDRLIGAVEVEGG
jgi:hypothetical protein